MFKDDEVLLEENIASNLIGLAVDYLTRLMIHTPKQEVFVVSLLGAKKIGEEKRAYDLLNLISGFDYNSVYYTCKLVGYDVCYRHGPAGYKDIDEIEPYFNTITNIQIMVTRSLMFFKSYGPVIKSGFTFEGGYTNLIHSGDGDFLTQDTLWDLKVSKNSPTSSHTLQLLIYYIMGRNSIHQEFYSINKLGIFNPRLNCVYLKNISDIPKETLDIVSKEIIGYTSKTEPEQNSNVNSDSLIAMSEISLVLSCSRYQVMKYYTQQNLPLIKIKNRYYIKKSALEQWIEEKKISDRNSIIFAIIVSAIFAISLIITLSSYITTYNYN